jgi:hypothetical protein
MVKLIDCEIWLAMNEDGDWIVTNCEDEAAERLTEDVGGYHARIVKVVVKMSPPAAAEATVTVPDDAGELQAVA